MAKPTWRQLVRAEPRLADLLKEAKAVDGSDPHFCANRVWYAVDGLKDRLCALVGWDRRNHPILGTEEAYDVAYDKIYGALPDCKDCWCIQATKRR